MRFNEMSREQHLALAAKGGKTPRPKQPRKEYCNRGHKLEGDNVEVVQRYSYNADKTKKYTYSTYRCRACMLASGLKNKRKRSRALREAKRNMPEVVRTHCIHGHPLTEGNVAYYRHKRRQPNGTVAIDAKQVCLQCHRERYKIRRYGRADEPDKRAETNKRLWTGKPNSERHKT